MRSRRSSHVPHVLVTSVTVDFPHQVEATNTIMPVGPTGQSVCRGNLSVS